jgi:hypothetical protein
MGRNRSQSIARQLKRGNIDELGNKLSRPFNNSKSKNPELQDRKKFYFGMKEYLKYLEEKEENEIQSN